MGFGSLMPTSGRHLTDTLAVFEAAARLSGQRVIIQADVDRPPTPRMLFVKRTPHRLVFPRCAAIVHHAGAGTTHTTLRAGAPSVPVPHVSDQYGWSDELHRLGIASQPLRRPRLTAEALASRIATVAGNEAMKSAAARLQARMAGDNGPLTAAVMVERAVGSVLD
jgi:UDP:flavonoid glycosyltransferase YjiC (YdhE family)